MKKTLANFIHDERGSLIPIITVSLILLLIVLHFSTDYNRMNTAFLKLQNTTDSSSVNVADWLAQARKDLAKKNVPNAKSWIPGLEEAIAVAKKAAEANFAEVEGYAKVQMDNSFQVNITNRSDGTAVEVKMCALVENDFTSSEKNKVCTNSTALIETLGMSDMEFVVTWDSLYGTGADNRDMVVQFITKWLSDYFVSDNNMRKNNLYAAFVPYTANVNIYPYDQFFLENENKPETFEPDYTLKKSLFDRTKSYPVFDDEDFNKMVSNRTDDIKFRSAYDYFRHMEVNGERGEMFEEQFPKFDVDTKKYARPYITNPDYPNSGTRFIEAKEPAYKGGIDGNTICKTLDSAENGPYGINTQFHPDLYNVFWDCERQYYKLNVMDEASNRWIQPLTNDYDVMMQALKTPKSLHSYSNANYYCDAEITVPSVRNVVNSLPDPARNYYFDPEYYMYYGSFVYSNGYSGLIWAWLTLSEKTKGKWDANSKYEQELNVVSDRRNLPQSSAESGRKKVIIQFVSSHNESPVTYENLICDPYVQFLPATDESLTRQGWISWFLQDEKPGFSWGSPNKPDTAASYEKLCKRLKEDGIDLYIIATSSTKDYSGYRENLYKSCVSSPDRFIDVYQDMYHPLTYTQAIDKVMANYTGDKYTIRLVK